MNRERVITILILVLMTLAIFTIYVLAVPYSYP